MPEVTFDLERLIEILVDHKPTSEGKYPQIVHYVPTEDRNIFVIFVRCIKVDGQGQQSEVSDTDMTLHLTWLSEFSVLRMVTYKDFSKSPPCDDPLDFFIKFANALNINSPGCISRLSIVENEETNEIDGVFSACFFTAEEELSQCFLDSAYRLFCREVDTLCAILCREMEKLGEEEDSPEDIGKDEKQSSKSWLH